MINIDTPCLQEQTDELLLLAQQVDQRAAKFVTLAMTAQEKSQRIQDELLSQISGVNESLAKINTASDSINAYVTLCAQHTTRTLQVFLGAVIGAVLIVAGTLWWSNHINDNLADSKAELIRLNAALKQMPVLMNFKGKDYVRILPNSETGFTRGDGSDEPGQYARVWHVR